MRRTIAQRLTASEQTIPHFYLTIDCDIGKLLAAREEINAAAPKDKDGKPAYKLRSTTSSSRRWRWRLQRVPDANVTWTEDGDAQAQAFRHRRRGGAAGGLITPIIRNAETKVAVGDLQRDEGPRGARARPAS